MPLSLRGFTYQRRRRPQKRPVQSKKKLSKVIALLLIVGAFFNHDFPGNRGRRPLPPTINFDLIDLDFYVVSYERCRWPKKRPVKSRKKLMNVEHRTSNIERRIMCSAHFKKDFAKRFHHSSFVIRQSSFVISCSFI